MTVYVVYNEEVGGNYGCACTNFAQVETFLEGSEPGDTLTIKIMEMTEAEVEGLGEFEGW